MHWFKENNMKVNPDKFQYIVFGVKENITCSSFVIDNVEIPPQSNVKLLGLYIDNHLKFDEQIKQICQKTGRQIQVLCRLSRILEECNKRLLYDSFIECYFNYCSVIWHFCSVTNVLKLEKVQQKALKFITLDFTASYKELLCVCNKNPLYLSRIHRSLELAFNLLNGSCPSYLNELVQINLSPYNFRSVSNLSTPKYNSITYGKKCLRYNIAYYYNMMPNEIKSAATCTKFKNMLKEWSPRCSCGFCILCKIWNM